MELNDIPLDIAAHYEQYTQVLREQQEFKQHRLKLRDKINSAEDAENVRKLALLKDKYQGLVKRYVPLEASRMLLQRLIEGVPQVVQEHEALFLEEQQEKLIEKQNTQFDSLQAKLEATDLKMAEVRAIQENIENLASALESDLNDIKAYFRSSKEAEARERALRTNDSINGKTIEVQQLSSTLERTKADVEKAKQRLEALANDKLALESEISSKLGPEAQRLADLLEEQKLCSEIRDTAAEQDISFYNGIVQHFENAFMVKPPVFFTNLNGQSSITIGIKIDPNNLASPKAGESDALRPSSDLSVPTDVFLITLMFSSEGAKNTVEHVSVKDFDKLDFQDILKLQSRNCLISRNLQTVLFKVLNKLYSIYRL